MDERRGASETGSVDGGPRLGWLWRRVRAYRVRARRRQFDRMTGEEEPEEGDASSLRCTASRPTGSRPHRRRRPSTWRPKDGNARSTTVPPGSDPRVVLAPTVALLLTATIVLARLVLTSHRCPSESLSLRLTFTRLALNALVHFLLDRGPLPRPLVPAPLAQSTRPHPDSPRLWMEGCSGVSEQSRGKERACDEAPVLSRSDGDLRLRSNLAFSPFDALERTSRFAASCLERPITPLHSPTTSSPNASRSPSPATLSRSVDADWPARGVEVEVTDGCGAWVEVAGRAREELVLLCIQSCARCARAGRGEPARRGGEGEGRVVRGDRRRGRDGDRERLVGSPGSWEEEGGHLEVGEWGGRKRESEEARARWAGLHEACAPVAPRKRESKR